MKYYLASLIVVGLSMILLIAASGYPKAQAGGSGIDIQIERPEAKSRSFEFRYGASINEVPPGALVRIWIPIAETNLQQDVNLIRKVMPDNLQLNRDGRYGNQIGFVEFRQNDPESVKFELVYDVVRYEATVELETGELTDAQKRLFLSENSLVPIEGKPQQLIDQTDVPAEPMAAGEMLFNVVDNHMSYDKSKPGFGNGDAVWACDSKTGNCTDFHSLFISLTRSRSIPARFEIGFPLPPGETSGTIGGYHCWAWFHVGGEGWIPVDISEADKQPDLRDEFFGKLSADRISFSTGRDIALVPKSDAAPLNFLIYPHVEINGERWSEKKITMNFSFRDKP